VKKVISISLTVLLLLSNAQLSFGKHFCGGLVVKNEWMLGHQHLDCGMGMMDKEKHHEDDPYHFDIPQCCDNEYLGLSIQLPSIQKMEDHNSSNQLPLVVEQAFPAISDLFVDSMLLDENHLYRPPPLPLTHSQRISLLQVFII
jgi:hypothetical protein